MLWEAELDAEVLTTTDWSIAKSRGFDDPRTFPLNQDRGEQGAEWDRDTDGAPDYFWPGEWADVPSGDDSSLYDCDDGDMSVQACD